MAFIQGKNIHYVLKDDRDIASKEGPAVNIHGNDNPEHGDMLFDTTDMLLESGKVMRVIWSLGDPDTPIGAILPVEDLGKSLFKNLL